MPVQGVRASPEADLARRGAVTRSISPAMSRRRFRCHRHVFFGSAISFGRGWRCSGVSGWFGQ